MVELTVTSEKKEWQTVLSCCSWVSQTHRYKDHDIIPESIRFGLKSNESMQMVRELLEAAEKGSFFIWMKRRGGSKFEK